MQSTPPRREVRSKLTYRETKELEQLPDRIALLEAEREGIAVRLADGSLYRGAPEEARRLMLRTTELDVELEHLLMRWDTLETRAA